MSTDQFIDDLLHAPDPLSRRVLLDTHFEFINLETIQRLKERADKMERDDAHLALQLSQAAGEMADRLVTNEAHGVALWMEANAHDLLSELDLAARSYERAADYFKKAGKDLEAARTSIGLMSTLMKAGEIEKVVALADSARPVFQEYGDMLSLAKVEMNLGALHFQQGQFVRAREAFKRASEAFQAQGDPLYAAMNQINQAASMTMLDDFLGAERLHELARPVFEKAELRSVAGSVEHDLAFLKTARGNYADALQTFEQARDTFAGLADTVNLAMTDLEESDLYLDLNLPTEALKLAEHAETAFKEMNRPFEQARAMGNRAVALARLGKRETASRLLETARSSFLSQDNKAWSAHADLQLAEIIGQAASQRDQARSLAAEALDAYESLEMKTKQGYAHIVAGNLWADDQRWTEALAELEEARKAIEQIAAPWLEQRIEVCAGRIYEGMGQVAQAIEHYQKAAEKTEQMAAAITAEEHRTAFVADKLAPYEALVSLYAQDNPGKAFQWAEQAKSRALVDLLSAGIRPKAHFDDKTEHQRMERLQELRDELNWLYTRLTRGAAPGEAGAPMAGPETMSKIKASEAEATSLWRDLQARHPETLSLLRGTAPSTEEIQAILPEQAALIEYFIGRGQVTAFVLTKTSIRAFPDMARLPDLLPLLEALAFQYSKFQFGPVYIQRHEELLLKGIQEVLAQLGKKLIEPFEKEISQADSLIIIPHGPLHSLPFQAIRVDQHYLVEKWAISYAPSAAVYKFCRDKAGAEKSQADPTGKTLLAGVPDENTSHIEAEIRALEKLFSNAEILLGEQATFERFRAASEDCEIVHLAAHGLFRPQAPLLSSIKLADRWLAVQDIYELNLKASLVTLSACETGLGHDAGGDDIVGLVRGFFHAGAKSLLVSLWMVDDEFMARLNTEFYTHWLEGDPKARALQKAQLNLLELKPHPYYWAPLILVGSEY